MSEYFKTSKLGFKMGISAGVVLAVPTLVMDRLQASVPVLHWALALMPVVAIAIGLGVFLREPLTTVWFNHSALRFEVRGRGTLQAGKWQWVHVRAYDADGQPTWNKGSGWTRKLASVRGEALVLADNSRAAR